jgi:predicted nucleic acid-binding protein
MRYFVDTDVVIDFVSGREPFFETAARFFADIEAFDERTAVAAVSFSHAYYQLNNELTHEECLARLESFKPLVQVLSVDEACLRRALRSNFKDFEDAVQHACAVNHKMDFIVTRNVRDYRASELSVLTPMQASEKIRKTR